MIARLSGIFVSTNDAIKNQETVYISFSKHGTQKLESKGWRQKVNPGYFAKLSPAPLRIAEVRGASSRTGRARTTAPQVPWGNVDPMSILNFERNTPGKHQCERIVAPSLLPH
jgi:hypothetical protein